MRHAAPLNPERLDVEAMAERGQPLQGQLPVAALERLSEEGGADEATARPAAEVEWSAQASREPVKGGAPRLRLHLQARALIGRTCQRCLQPVSLDLAIDRHFWFAPNETLAEQWDAESDDDVLVLARSLNLHELIEDELLLALPIVPRHEQCPVTLPHRVGEDDLLGPSEGAEDDPPADHPFAALARLRRSND